MHIINMDASDSAGGGHGTHWVGLWCGVQDAIYFDSFGAPPPVEVQDYIFRRYRRYGYNAWIIQDYDSNACGLYVVAFANAVAPQRGGRLLKDAANNFVNLFGENTKNNDQLLLTLI